MDNGELDIQEYLFSLCEYMVSFLTSDEISVLKMQHKKLREKRLADRIKSLLCLNQGYSYEEVSNILLIDDSTVREAYSKFREGGIELLLTLSFTGRDSFLTSSQKQELSIHLEAMTYMDSKEIAHHIEEKYGVTYSQSGVKNLLSKLGFVYKKAKHLPSKANAEKQKEFIQQYEDLKATKSSSDSIYFIDGVHPMHNSMPSYGWIKKGTEKMVKSNTGRNRLNINGALQLDTKEVIIEESETINSQSTMALLDKIQAKQSSGIIYTITDNARYYKSQVLKEYLEKNPRIHMLFLPPYSPNLNIIERLWKFFKKKVCYNQYYETFKEFKEKTLSFFEQLILYRPQLNSLLTDNFQTLPI